MEFDLQEFRRSAQNILISSRKIFSLDSMEKLLVPKYLS